tara:strand:+ start:6322 stop:8271 length:1950 start_codon:yes stop_codon:yes gene_type:complete
MAILIDFDFVSYTAAGAINAGGTVTFYDTGTTTLKAVYSDAALTTPLSNPYTLDSAGRFSGPIYAADGERYAILESTSGAASIRTRDPVWGSVENPISVRVVHVDDYGTYSATSDNSATVQAAIDAYRAAYDSTLNAFPTQIDFGGKNWLCSSSIDATMIRNPGFTLQNGGITSTATGKIALDLAGTNAPKLLNFDVWGDETSTPAVGIYIGRALISGGYPACANANFIKVTVRGYYTKGAVVNFASEVSSNDACFFQNKSRSLSAYGYINVGHAQTLDTYVSGLTSDYATLPTAATGAHSNVLHNEGQLRVQRDADVVLTATAITQANPAVVTATGFSSSGLTNGQTVFFHDVAGMTELNGGTYTIANASGDTFELSGTDSTAYGAFTSGRVFNQTGGAILLSGTHRMECDAGYVLTYGAPAFVIDEENAVSRGLKLSFHAEADVNTVFDFRRTTGTFVAQGYDISILNSNQEIHGDVFRITGGGSGRFDALKLRIDNMASAPSNGIFRTPGDWTIRDASIAIPINSAMNTITSFAAFSGDVFTGDNGVKQHYRFRLGNNGDALANGGEMRYTAGQYYGYDYAERRFSLATSATTTQLADNSHSVNTTAKYEGKMVFNTTTTRPVWAAGGAAGDVWVDSAGSTLHTPV